MAEPTPADLLKSAKLSRINDINVGCRGAYESGNTFLYTAASIEYSIFIKGDTINTYNMNIRAEVNSVKGKKDFNITDSATGETHTVLYPKGKDLLDDIVDFFAAYDDRVSVKTGLISACTTVEQVNLITWDSVE